MSLESSIIALALASEYVEAIIEDRIRPVSLDPGDGYPNATVHLVDDGRLHTMDGATSEGEGRVQIACRGRTFDQAAAARIAVIRALDGIDGTQKGYWVSLFQEDAGDRTGFVEDGDEEPIHRQDVDFVVLWAERP